MKWLLKLLSGKVEPDWTILRLRAIEDRPIGPRYPCGLFVIRNW